MSAESVILFDGVCNLCAGVVRFVARRDPRGRFAFAPLGSPAAQRLLKRAGVDPATFAGAGAGAEGAPDEDAPSTILLVDRDGVHARSEASLRIARGLRAPWPALWIFRLLPLSLRDALYDAVARRRYAWFGRSDECMVPTPELRARFLEQ
ncbi:MAG: DCC1-like thiol-disulfide oxidoreductase family protein [Phycisphaerales bacterium]